jgi:hypothetical protein
MSELSISAFEFAKDRYDSTTVTVFECMATYFTEVFFYHLYNVAMKYEGDSSYKNVDSITKGYILALERYTESMESPRFYRESIKGILGVLRREDYKFITFSETISLITKRFFPEGWDVTAKNENKMMVIVFTRCLKKIINKVRKVFIRIIIDERNDETISRLQDAFLHIFIHEKENIPSEIDVHLHETQQNPILYEKVTAIKFNKLASEYKKILNENTELNTLIRKLQKIITANNDKYNKLLFTTNNLRSKLDNLQYTNTNDVTGNMWADNDTIPDVESSRRSIYIPHESELDYTLDTINIASDTINIASDTKNAAFDTKNIASDTKNIAFDTKNIASDTKNAVALDKKYISESVLLEKFPVEPKKYMTADKIVPKRLHGKIVSYDEIDEPAMSDVSVYSDDIDAKTNVIEPDIHKKEPQIKPQSENKQEKTNPDAKIYNTNPKADEDTYHGIDFLNSDV